MSYKNIFAIMALSTMALGMPATANSTAVQPLPASVKGPTVSALKGVPADLDPAVKSFLDGYQCYSDEAIEFIGSKNGDTFTDAGLCYAEYPCFTVEAGAMVKMGSAAPITPTQMRGLLDTIIAMPVVQFDQANHDTPFNGFKVTSNGTVFEVISSPALMPSNVMAGIAFDMYKMQGHTETSNSIRGLLAATDYAPNPHTALCLYPEGIDVQQAGNFCVGKEPSGALKSSTHIKRSFSLAGLLVGFCHFVDVPLLCPQA